MLRSWSHGQRSTWGQPATARPPPSHQQANNQLTSPSSQGAENRSLRPARAVLLGPKCKETSAKAVGRGGLEERSAGHVPRHPSQSRPRQGLRDAHFLLPPILGRSPSLRVVSRLRSGKVCQMAHFKEQEGALPGKRQPFLNGEGEQFPTCVPGTPGHKLPSI